jgi:hypothetical protein
MSRKQLLVCSFVRFSVCVFVCFSVCLSECFSVGLSIFLSEFTDFVIYFHESMG